VRVPYAEGVRSHILACAADRAGREGRPVRLGG
jgi:myo-inositol 2-dehydrogenase/D-chiro-inositol 1-dehydrogenase